MRSKREKRITQSELVQSIHPINSIAAIHLFLGRWDIKDNFEYWYKDIKNGDIVFVYAS